MIIGMDILLLIALLLLERNGYFGKVSLASFDGFQEKGSCRGWYSRYRYRCYIASGIVVIGMSSVGALSSTFSGSGGGSGSLHCYFGVMINYLNMVKKL